MYLHVSNVWSYTSTPPYVFMVWFIKHRDKLKFDCLYENTRRSFTNCALDQVKRDEMISPYSTQSFVVKPERKRPLGRPRLRLGYSVKTDLKEA
jgi:hypothetical protein